MALQKQSITIPLGLGVNTKTDEKLVEQGAFNLVCENATFEKVGAVKKRQAYEPQATTYYAPSADAVVGSGSYPATYEPTCAATNGKSILLRNLEGSYLYSHNDSFLLGAGKIPETKIRSKLVYSPSSSVTLCDTVYDSSEGILAIVARRSDGANLSSEGGALILYDTEKETSVVASETNYISGSDNFGYMRAGFTRVASVSYYYSIYVNSNQVIIIVPHNKYGQEYSADIVFALNILSYGSVTAKKGPIGICQNTANTECYIIVPTTTANTGKFIAMSGLTKTVETTFTYTGTGCKSASARYNSVTGKIDYVYVRDGGQVNKIIFNTDGTVSTADANIASITGATSIAYNQESDAFAYTGAIGYSVYDSSDNFKNSYTEISSDMVSVSGVDSRFVIDRYGQLTHFAITDNLTSSVETGYTVHARLRPGSGKRTSLGQVCRLSKLSSSEYVFAHPYLIISPNGPTDFALQLTFLEISQNYKSNSRATIGSNVHLQGGFLCEFDGEKLFENGFHLPPSKPTLAEGAAGALTGDYSYYAVFRYTDKNGQVTRSEPSLVSSELTVSAKKIDVTVLSLQFGIKPLDCFIELYRNTDGGTTFYYATGSNVNMYSAVSFVITDNATDNAISSNAILYTSGNIIPNNPAPACKLVCQGGNRIFLAGLEDEDEIYYSKKKLFGECANFSRLFKMRFDLSQYNITGGVTGIGYMDDKFIVFKRNSIFYVAGDGPNELGNNDTFTSPELVSSDTGCTDPRSIILTPVGIMFKGDKGIYLLSRGMASEYIGAPVESYNDYQVTSAVHLDKKSQVVFTLRGDDDSTEKYQLVYDYFTQQWSVIVGLVAIDGDVIDGDHLILDANSSTPYVQNGTDFTDSTTAYSIKVKTPWIKVSGIQDFGRIWSATILGTYKSAHTLRVTVYYDYATDYSEVYNIVPDVLDSQYQYRIHLQKQKCESIQFVIQDLDQSGTKESMELTALTLEVGVKKGSMKLAAGRKY